MLVKIYGADPQREITPAMAAGLAGHVWDVADIVSIIEAAEPATAKRGPYKKRAAA
jgi:hypothetical protein